MKTSEKYISIFLLVSTLIFAGCETSSIGTEPTEQVELSDSKNDKSLQTHAKPSLPLETNDAYIDTSELALENNPAHDDQALKIPFTIVKYEIEHSDFHKAPIAPQYVNEDFIAFDINPSGSDRASIGVFDRKSKGYKKVYVAPVDTVINSLVGINNTLYWVEYGKKQKKDNEWRIMSYDLYTKSTDLVKKGISPDGTSTPIIRNTSKELTWIEYEFKDQTMISKAIVFVPSTKVTKMIATTKLDESSGRNGRFFAIQRPSQNGMIIHESIYTQNSYGDSQKTYEISFYPYDHSSPKLLLDGRGIIDYAINQKWFVWTEEGRVTVADMQTGKIKYRFFGKSNKLTNDTPYLINDYLFYRYGMNQIFVVDLNKGARLKLSDDFVMTSKLFNSEDYLFFRQWKTLKNTGYGRFFVIDLSKENDK